MRLLHGQSLAEASSGNNFSKPLRILVINPNSTEAFSYSMRELNVPGVELDFYTAPESSPASIEGTTDGILSTAACIGELRSELDRWDGFVVACFSLHPLTHLLRELTSSPVISILESPLLLASTLGSSVGILTTSPRWVPLLTHDVSCLHLNSLCSAGIVSSGLSVLDLEHLPIEEVKKTLGQVARRVLVDDRGADVIILGCAGMVGLDEAVKRACGEGVEVLDPVRCGLEVCASLVRMGAKTSKKGIYAKA